MEERIEWQGHSESQIGGEEKSQSCWCCRDQQSACRMAQASAEKPEHTGPARKERVASVPQREQLASTPEPPLPKEKSHPFKHQIVRCERVNVSESRTLGREGDQSGSMERKGWTPQ